MLYTKILRNDYLRGAFQMRSALYLKKTINKMIEQLVVEVDFESEHNNLRELQTKLDPFERDFDTVYEWLEEFYKICDRLKVWVSYE